MRVLRPVRRMIAVVCSVLLIVGLLEAVQFAAARHAGRAHADASTGTAGLFVPLQARLYDSTSTIAANTPITVAAAGQVGIPSTGVATLAVSVTAVTSTNSGAVQIAPSGSSSWYTAVLYDGAESGEISNTAMVALGSDGKIQIQAQTAVRVLLDVQGYFTSGNGSAAPGGYVPVTPTRLVDTRNGTGLPLAKLANGSTSTITVGGHAGVPTSGVSAVFLQITPINYGTGPGHLTPYPFGGTKPGTSINFVPDFNTVIGTNVDTDDAGKLSLYVANGSAIDLVVDVVGYYTAASTTTGAFTPGAATVYDSRKNGLTKLASGETRTIPVAGIAGVPLVGSGISNVAINVQLIHPGGHYGGTLKIFPDDQAEPYMPILNFDADTVLRENLAITPVGVDGGVKVKNISSDPVNVELQVEGWYANVGTPISNGQTRTQQSVTLQASAVGGSYVTYEYRTDTTASFSNVPGLTTGEGKTSGAFPAHTWNLTTLLGATAPDTLVQVEACYGTSASDPSPVCSMPLNIDYARSSFGASNASTDIGPGTLALLTGNYQVSATDVNVPTYQGNLSIGRTLTTLAPTGEVSGATGIFGPGWTADLPGSDSGEASLSVTDNTAQGYLVFTDTDGSAAIYQLASDPSSYPISYAGVGDAAADGTTVSKLDANTISMTDADGTVTTWTKTTAGWGPSSIVEPGSHTTTSYTRDASTGVVTRILGPAPTGVDCSGDPNTTPGCRSLTLNYTTVAGHTRLLTVTFHAYDPATSAMTLVDVARYDYNSNGTLLDAYDPRISPSLKTTYTYDGNGRLASLTPPGQAAWSFTYDGTGRLSTVSRTDPALTGPSVSTVVYQPSSLASSPIDLSSTAIAAWGQTDQPLGYTAVFDANHQPASTSPGSVTSTDWPYATVHYLDVNGRETNTGSYGAGAWQYGATNYDTNGNAALDLTPSNRAQATSTTYATLATTTLYDPVNPDQVTDSYGPVHPVQPKSGGATINARTHTHTVYDQGAPLDEVNIPIHYGLPTTVTTSAFNIATSTDIDATTVTNDYGSITSGGTTGWDLHAATASTTKAATGSGGDLTTNTRYNDAGQTVQSWLPGSSGSDARSTSTTYYTAGSTGTCVSSALAGLPCTVGPTAQPATGNPLPVKTFTYNLYNQPLTVTETAGSTVRTTTTTYDAAGRALTSSIAVTPTAAGGTTLPTVTTGYSTTTGLPTTVTTGSGGSAVTLTTGYDTLGRVTSYTDANGTVSSTTYDLAGNVATSNDGKGTVTYSYDTSTEHRGMVTSEDLGVSPALTTMSATYNADGNLTTQTYPNGLVATSSYNNTGNPTQLQYAKSGTTWMTFTQTPDAQDNTATQTSPASSQSFGYDTAGRLTSTQDTVASSCTTRTYTYDGTSGSPNVGVAGDSNRTYLASYPAGTGGACSTGTTPTTTASTYDGADRITNTGYAYDTLGRTTTVPSADAKGLGSHGGTTGNLTVGYYANDYVATQAQGSASLSFTLDPLQNRVLTSNDGTTTTTNHYDSSSDRPSWTSTSGTTWTRYIAGPSGDLAASITQAGTVTLQLTNMHGDIIGTSTDTTGATGVTGYSESTEYGAPRTPASAPDTYGWLGAKQRSTNDLAGLSLMGVRLYNPATGRFLSVDPIFGGNANPYVYALNPIDGFDLSGQCCGWFRKHWKTIRRVTEIAAGAAFVGAFCAGTGGIGCVIGASAFYGGVTGGFNYSMDHRHQSGGQYQRGLARATVVGAARGAIVPYTIGRITGGRATGLFGVAKRIFHVHVRWRDMW